MIHLICYDISSNKIRSKISKRLIAEGYTRIQLSVFVGNPHPQKNLPLWNDFQTWLNMDPNCKFYVLRISKDNFKNILYIGKNKLDIPYLLGEKNSIFI